MARGDGSVVVRIVGEIKDLASKLGQAGTEIEGFSKRTTAVFRSAFGDVTSVIASRFGAVGNQAKSALDGMAADAVSSGSAIGLGVGAGAAVAGAALIKMGVDGIKSFVDLADQIRNIQRVSGASAADASKLNATFQALNVDTEAGAKAMFLLSKNIDANTQKLRDHGIEVAHNKNGSVDLYTTLLNVRDAYQRVGEGQEGNAIAAAAFGRSGAALLPVLSATRDRLNEINAAAREHGLNLSQKEIDDAKQYEIALQELHDAFSGLERAIGEEAVPALTKFAKILTQTVDVLRPATKAVEGFFGRIVNGNEVIGSHIPIVGRLVSGFQDLTDSSGSLASATDTLGSSTSAAAGEMSAAEQAASDFSASLKTLEGDAFGVIDAQDAVANAWQSIEDKAKQAADAQDQAVQRQQDAASRLADTEEQVAQRISDAQDRVTQARDDAAKINKPGQQRDEANKRVADAEKALARTTRDGDKEIASARTAVAKASKEVADQIDRWSPSLDRATTAGRENATQLEKIVDGVGATVTEMEKEGVPAVRIKQYLDEQYGLIVSQGTRIGFNRDQLNQFLTVLQRVTDLWTSTAGPFATDAFGNITGPASAGGASGAGGGFSPAFGAGLNDPATNAAISKILGATVIQNFYGQTDPAAAGYEAGQATDRALRRRG